MALTTIDLVALELVEVWSKADESQRVSFTFPISAETGASGSSVAYAEIAPGGGIPWHFDSANECDLILEGELEYALEDEAKTIGEGVLIQVPAQTKHRVMNRTGSAVRIVFFFDSAQDVVTFDEPLMPMDASVLGAD